MGLPPEAIDEFRQIYYQEHGIQLSDDDAHRLANELYVLGKTFIDMAHESEKPHRNSKVQPNQSPSKKK